MKVYTTSNGRKWANMQVTHRVNRFSIADCLCFMATHSIGPIYINAEDPQDLSRKQIEDIVHIVLRERPLTFSSWRDDVGPEAVATLSAWARELTKLRFPELVEEAAG